MAVTLAGLLTDVPSAGPAVGVEQEWQLWLANQQVDFRLVMDRIEGIRLSRRDPGDRWATRLPSGYALTADGWEAELASPPTAIDGEAPFRLGASLGTERARLRAGLLGVLPGIELAGFSTHINVSVQDELVVAVAREFTLRCGLAASLFLGHAGTPGLVVRPRRGRLEVCGDYVEGEDLAAAITFVTASAAMLTSGSSEQLAAPYLLPRRQQLALVPARERFGFYLDRGATGADLFERGRATPLPQGAGTAQDQLEEAWGCARPFALALGLDPSGVDARVLGRLPLPLERDPGTPARRCAQALSEPAIAPADLAPRHLPGLTLHPAWLTWGHVAWSCTDDRGRHCYAVLPAAQERVFLALVDEGKLTPLFRRALRPRAFFGAARDAMVSVEQANRPGLWRRLRPAALVPVERGSDGAIGGSGAGQGPDRKRESQHDAPRPRRFIRSSPKLVAAGSLVVVAAVVGAAVATGGDDPRPASDVGARSGSAGTSPSAGASGSPTPAEDPAPVDLSGTYQGVARIAGRYVQGGPTRTKST